MSGRPTACRSTSPSVVSVIAAVGRITPNTYTVDFTTVGLVSIPTAIVTAVRLALAVYIASVAAIPTIFRAPSSVHPVSLGPGRQV